MKRAGHIYEQMADWVNIVEAEKISTKRKSRNTGVRHHARNRWNNLIEIQNMVLEHRMKTNEYMHEQRISGQDKMRDIAKLKFHPSHIEHQLITMAGDRRIDRCLIRHTYASRKGYGQTRCALRLKKVISQYIGQERWYGQGDIRKYYDSIPHSHIKKELDRIFKDEAFVKVFMEPFERFASDGVGIPLGIRPSQSIGNLSLTSFDHFMTEVVKAPDYTRYLDDFFFTAATKGRYAHIGQELRHDKPVRSSKYAMEYLRNKLVLQADLRIVRGLSATVSWRWQDRVGQDNAPYTLLDGRISWSSPIKNYTVYCSCSNILDREYKDYSFIEQPGRWMTMGVTVSW